MKLTTSAALAVSLLPACIDGAGSIEEAGRPVVYGTDDRAEFYDVPSLDRRERMADSMAALIPHRFLTTSPSGDVAISAPSWGEAAGLCPGERFADQPAAAFCTGVLVDSDLVLTAGHCARVRALDQFSIVFGYFYSSPGAISPLERHEPTAIVAEALTPDGEHPSLDYAWLRLDHPVRPPRQPSPVRWGVPSLARGEELVSIGAGGGVPLKLDTGGKVSEAREATSDYFYATTDTSRGSSGGGAFDAEMALVGILATGEADFILTEDGCATTDRLPDETEAGERFGYARIAVEGLCRKGDAAETTTICRPNCEVPCQALPLVPHGDGGCRYTPTGAPLAWITTLGLELAFLFFRPRSAPTQEFVTVPLQVDHLRVTPEAIGPSPRALLRSWIRDSVLTQSGRRGDLRSAVIALHHIRSARWCSSSGRPNMTSRPR